MNIHALNEIFKVRVFLGFFSYSCITLIFKFICVEKYQIRKEEMALCHRAQKNTKWAGLLFFGANNYFSSNEKLFPIVFQSQCPCFCFVFSVLCFQCQILFSVVNLKALLYRICWFPVSTPFKAGPSSPGSTGETERAPEQSSPGRASLRVNDQRECMKEAEMMIVHLLHSKQK